MEVKKIYITIGRISVGKDSFADAVFPQAKKIDIGTLVRKICKQVKRVHYKHLDEQILIEVANLIATADTEEIIITGIRQLSLYKALQESCLTNGLKFTTFHLQCPEEVCKRRWLKRADPKDAGLTFEDIIKKDGELGLDELEEFVTVNQLAQIINTNINEADALQKIKEWKATAMEH